MQRIILSGALGAMGQAVIRQAARRTDARIVAGLDCFADKCGAGADNQLKIFSDFGGFNAEADVVIDFSHPSMIDGLLDFCVARRLPLIICTTGLADTHLQKISAAAQKIAVLQSSNTSTGVLFLHKLVKMAAKELFGKYDIEIVESHHNQKADAPSGTAAALFNTVKSVVPSAVATYDRHSVRQKRDKNEVGMHSVRGGGIVGKHDVIFAGGSDCITISHEAFSKDVFAAGAIDAALILAAKPAGLYTMQDIFSE